MRTPSSPVREIERERDREREKDGGREREKEGGRVRERDVEHGCFIFIFERNEGALVI